jgi:PAS domain S-box-containing protein
MHVCCFAHIELLDDDEDYFVLEALEYSRQHREDLLRQEFGSWMLEDKIESSVIATDPMGSIVFWNRFAAELYQWNREEVLGRSIIEVTPSEMTQEQAAEIFSRLSRGEHWKGFFGVQRKDSSIFMAHVIDTPVVDSEGKLRFVVGISDDYTQVHDLMNELKTLNSNLEQEAIARTEQLLEKEKTLRMVGAAVKESDTGVLITEDDFRIVWSNDAVSKLLHLPENVLMNSYPWELPIEVEIGNAEKEKHGEMNAEHIDLRGSFLAKSNFNVTVQVPNCDSEAGKVLAVHVQSMPGTKQNMFILRDLTFEIKAEKAQREAEKAAAASKIKTEMLQMLSHVSVVHLSISTCGRPMVLTLSEKFC